ncbi:MAG: hypothetical protein R6X10_01080 [Desulfobacterales bacterium]
MRSQNAYAVSETNVPLFFDHNSYIDYCLELAIEKLVSYDTIADLTKDLSSINAYENIDFLEEPKKESLLDLSDLTSRDYNRAFQCILDGKLFSEHAAAGEATRLGLGTKYLINIKQDLSLDKISELMSCEMGLPVSRKDILEYAGCHPENLLPLSVGVRHMLQFSYDIVKLAKFWGYDPKEVLSKQRMLIVLNEETASIIIEEFIKNRFYGFMRKNVLFMIQEAYHGICLDGDEVVYDRLSPRRLHNHGHIAIQQTMPNQVFRIDGYGNKVFLSSCEFGEIYKQMDDKISYNIEDLGYFIGSIDYQGLAMALKKGAEGCRMLMEVVQNNSSASQKGGMAAFDRCLGKNVMIESFQLKGIDNHNISFLNKNINHYPEPHEAWLMVKKYGLKMPVAVKDGYIYFQPVQGDINFLVNTAFFMRKNHNPIKAWKSSSTTPLAIKYMHMQDCQHGFREYSEYLLEG